MIRVMIIDDDPVLSALASGVLEHLGCTCVARHEASGVADELAAAEAAGTPFELVLLDIQLGDAAGSGFDVCRALRARGLRVPIVCVSGEVENHHAATFQDAGFDGALAKPVSVEALEACLAKHTRR